MQANQLTDDDLEEMYQAQLKKEAQLAANASQDAGCTLTVQLEHNLPAGKIQVKSGGNHEKTL